MKVQTSAGACYDRPVSEVMQREVATLQEGDRLDLAEDLMHLGRVRHMPVLEGERLIGVVSDRDVLAASLTKALEFEPSHRRSFLRSVEVREVMSRDVFSVSSDTPLSVVAGRMIERKIGCVPVVGPGDTLVGMVTETDLLRAAFLEAEADGVSPSETAATRD